MKPLDGPVVDASFAEIGKPDITAVRRICKIPLEMPHREVIGLHHALALIHFLALGISHLMLLYFDMVFTGKVTERFPIGHLLMLHYEIDRAATLAATEAFTNPF